MLAFLVLNRDNQVSKNVKNTFILFSNGNKRLKGNESAVINSNSEYSEIQDELERHFQHHSNFHIILTFFFFDFFCS